MTEREQEQLRHRDRLRISVILGLCLVLAVPVVVAMAASPDPSASAAASEAPSASASSQAPAATTEAAPVAPVAPSATDKPSVDKQKVDGKGFRGFGNGHGAITITAISGSKLSLKTDDGWTRTITVTADTALRKGGQEIALGDLEVGDQIRFSQKRNDDGTYTVTAIQVPTAKTGGEVTAINGNTLTLKRRNGETQPVTVNGSTLYKSGGAAASKSDVKVGSRVTVQGETSGTTFTALTVHIEPTVVGGEVTAKTADSLTVKQRDGSSVVIHIASDTKLRVRGETKGLAGIAVGDVVVAAGLSRSDGSIDATVVGKGRGKGERRNKDGQPKVAPSASATPG